MQKELRSRVAYGKRALRVKQGAKEGKTSAPRFFLDLPSILRKRFQNRFNLEKKNSWQKEKLDKHNCSLLTLFFFLNFEGKKS